MGAMARYRRDIGIIDANGKRHKIDAFAKVPLHRLDWLKTLTWLFGGLGFGFLFRPAPRISLIGRAVDVVKGDDIMGGHYVPMLGLNEAGNFVCTSWARASR